MKNINSLEALMNWVINKLAERFGKKALLKGGILLNLLDCPRLTNDLNYVFTPFKSKKEILAPLLEALSELEDAKITHTLHSTNLRIILEYKGLKLQIEANTSEKTTSQEMSTASLAGKLNQLPRMIRVMKLDEALAHKMAAWNERGLMRDLYDIYFFHQRLGIKPNLEILLGRLSKINNTEKSQKNKPRSMDLAQFLDKLKQRAITVTDAEFKKELMGVLSKEDLMGISLKIRSSLLSLADYLLTQ